MYYIRTYTWKRSSTVTPEDDKKIKKDKKKRKIEKKILKERVRPDTTVAFIAKVFIVIIKRDLYTICHVHRFKMSLTRTVNVCVSTYWQRRVFTTGVVEIARSFIKLLFFL